MTSPGSALPRDLAARLFRALYTGTTCAPPAASTSPSPKGTLWFAGHSLSEIACQISADPPPGPDREPRARPLHPPAGTSS
jgi:hypothetical protein